MFKKKNSIYILNIRGPELTYRTLKFKKNKKNID